MALIFLFKCALVLFVLFIMFNLVRALFQMMSTNSDGKSMTHFLGKRLLFSTLIISLVFIALLMGWITPNPRPY
ncbi:hypothetical protein BCU68_03270 [Vibrio sp. 10N.286.49.B3]|uniref:DUF2909 domain-containing protein n=1 Tax=Vibrio sp. 10N.286.49.B3 TaxID=1880855 RepID=UPI000C851A62|nr:DUF2909 domain-containing protein [Vibrio sp. 10N.286.49.B3]PMH44535.1 hypothetical protein BCU68_03270 [Vibrio sp. 10N.286.49.B3]